MKMRNVITDDLDKVFSYRSLRFVIIKDLWLGLTHKLITALIWIYVGLIAIYLNEGYIKKEFTAQTTATTLLVKSGGSLVTGSRNTSNIYPFKLKNYMLILTWHFRPLRTATVLSLQQSMGYVKQ